MTWGGIAIEAGLGLALIVGSVSFLRSGDAVRDARMTRGLQMTGALLFHLAALMALVKLAGAP